MNRFCFKTNYHIIRLIKTIRCIYYGEERSSMARKAEPIIISTVEFDYVGTDEQFNTFLKSVVKDRRAVQHVLKICSQRLHFRKQFTAGRGFFS